MTHISFTNTTDEPSYERLEFLGDSVLGLCIADILYEAFTDMTEGRMSAIKSYMANEKTLAQIGRDIGLLEVVKLGNGEHLKDKRAQEKVLCDLFESTLATIYLQHGFKKCKEFISILLHERMYTLFEEGVKDFKTRLQRITVKIYKEYPTYQIVDTEGPDHGKIFTVKGDIAHFTSLGKGRSKKEAEQKVAQLILDQMEEHVKEHPDSPLKAELSAGE